MPATLFHKITENFAGTLFVGHSEGELLYLEQVALRATTPAHIIDSMVRALGEMRHLSGNTVAAPSHVVRFLGQIGIVTPYFEALPLRLLQVAAREKQFPIPTGVAVKIALDVFDGLCQYHALEAKLYGGICPDQLLVGTDGDTRVGNVAVPAITPKESPWRGKVERLSYLAPEQVTASKGYDARTDVYTMGVILWEMIANQPRVAGAPAQILELLRRADGPAVMSPLDESKVSKGLINTLSRALHANPSERQPSIGVFARDLLEADEAPATAQQVAAYVEQVAKQLLQVTRTAIALEQIQVIKQSRTTKSEGSPPAETAKKALVGKSQLSPSQSSEAGLPQNSDHTAVFKVTAELLEKARRGPTPGESTRPIAGPVAVDLPVESDQTVTFEVPENLLEEARRLFEATEQAASTVESEFSAPSSSHNVQPTGSARVPAFSKGATLAIDPPKGRTPVLATPKGPALTPTPSKGLTSVPAAAGPASAPAPSKSPTSVPAATSGSEPESAISKGPTPVPTATAGATSALAPSKGPTSAHSASKGLSPVSASPFRGSALAPDALKGPLSAPRPFKGPTSSPVASKAPASAPAVSTIQPLAPPLPSVKGVSEERTLDQKHSEELLKKLRVDGPASTHPIKPPVSKYDDDVTTIWHPELQSGHPEFETDETRDQQPSAQNVRPAAGSQQISVSSQQPASAIRQPSVQSRRVASQSATLKRRGANQDSLVYWLLGVVISIVVGALTILASRMFGH